jgi:hypothetical protein
MRKGNGPSTTKEKIRAKAYEEDVEDTKGRGNGAEFVDTARGIPVKTFEPEEVAARRGVDASVPKEDIPENEHIDLRIGKDAFDRLKGEPFRGRMSRAPKTDFGQRNIGLLKNESVRFIRSSGPDEKSEDSKRQCYYGGDDEHPPPAGETMDAVESGGSTGLDQACSKGTECQANIKKAASTANFVTTIPGAEDVVDARKVCSLKDDKSVMVRKS